MSQVKKNPIYLKLKCWGLGNSYGLLKWDDEPGDHLKQILIWHSKFISGIQAIYERNNDIHVSQRHGGEEGDIVNIYLEKPLTWMSGHYKTQSSQGISNFISSLKFGNEEKTYGPFGEEAGQPFEYRGEDEIVGLHGWSNDTSGHITAIGPYIKIKGAANQPSQKTSHVFVQNTNPSFLMF